MSKLVVTMVAGSGAAVASVGGAYLIQQSGETGNSEKQPGKGTDAPATQNSKLEFEDLQKFKDGKGGKCAKDMFGDTDVDFSSANGTPSTTPTGDSYFGAAPTDNGENTKGCLIINWEKKISSAADGNGSGTFTGTGAFVNSDKGFITFNVAKTNVKDSKKQLDLTGGFYLLEKDSGTSGTWTIKGWKEITESDNKKIETTDFSKFPKAKEGSVVKENNKDYWDFFNGQEALDKISNDVTATPTSDSKRGSGTWKKDTGNSKVGEWDDSLNWGDHMYDKTATVDLKTKLDSFDKGAWTKVESQSS